MIRPLSLVLCPLLQIAARNKGQGQSVCSAIGFDGRVTRNSHTPTLARSIGRGSGKMTKDVGGA
ncbi:MAG: hypothetical protein ACM359_20415, partial [Bacillota bacterium]